MKKRTGVYEGIIKLVKKLEVVTVRDVEKNLKMSYPTAIKYLLEMELEGYLKHRVIMTRQNKNYKVWILKKHK